MSKGAVAWVEREQKRFEATSDRGEKRVPSETKIKKAEPEKRRCLGTPPKG